MSNFKIKELNIFGSTETLFYNRKKYRKVFDELESCYVYCEIAFHNKRFDEYNWDTRANLRCFNEASGEMLCDLNKVVTVDMNTSMMYIREGWGTPQAGWWKKGKYRWTVTLDGVHVGDVYFYITGGGFVTSNYNPYFEIDTVKLYESPRSGAKFGDRTYLKTFNAAETRYVNLELTLRNLQPTEELYPLEVHFNFFNDAGQHKAYVSYLYEYTDKPALITFDSGYGSEGKDYWVPDHYGIEVIFMDTLIAVVPFEISTTHVEADRSLPFTTGHGAATFVPSQATQINAPANYEQAKGELDALIGLHAVKEQISEMATYLQFLKLRQENGFDESQKFTLHTVFTGNPGTGKTTVARLLGKIYASLGLLSDGKIHEVGRVDLVGEYIGQTAPKVKKAIEVAKGGILFIDEAYSLSDRGDDSKDFGREVIEVLLKEMSDGTGDLAVIFAGYPKEMTTFMNVNPGLSSRINSVIHFPDYSPDELMKIADFQSDKTYISFSDESRAYLHRKVVEAYRNRGDNFGNARFVMGVINGAKQNLALRFMKMHEEKTEDRDYTSEELSTVILTDVEKLFGRDKNKTVTLPIDEPMLKDALAQLDELAGLKNVKKEISETVKLVRYYREVGKDMSKSFSLHTVFTGNPGTGKTTVARILAQIYKALGILERGHLVETDRKGMVAEFVGQTAAKTSGMIDSALGGCLFIDEAYALTNQGGNDFGRECIETLLKRMEDQRGKFMVIVAGYTDEMKRFLEANPGLMSRFDKTFEFEDYSESELVDIAIFMFSNEDLKLEQDAADFLHESVKKLLANKHKYFGNARTVRKLVEEAVRRQNLRMAETSAAERTQAMIHSVTVTDLKGVSLLESERQTGAIGFRSSK
ncbi:MAG: stage sporulation protein [Bacteroidota bacterium]|jgi:SpoVK/Ycf46/Vps4 family AAA+-type ATPase